MNITVKQIQANDSDKVYEFYLKALFDEHKNLISDADAKLVLTDSKELFKKSYIENKALKTLIAFNEEKDVIGFSWFKNFDSPQDVIFQILVMTDEKQNNIRDLLFENIVTEFPSIKNLYTDIYKRSLGEVKYYESKGFTVWEESTAPAGKATMEVYLMKKSI